MCLIHVLTSVFICLYASIYICVCICLIMCIYPFNLIDKFNIHLVLSPDNLIIIGNYLIDKLNLYNLVLNHFCQWVTG